MEAVNMHEAKSRLSALVEAVESGREAEVVIARNGKPAARLVPIAKPDVGKRIGVAAGLYTAPSDEAWAEMDEEIERMFLDEVDGEPAAK
jgi:prevent-host-death family protein